METVNAEELSKQGAKAFAPRAMVSPEVFCLVKKLESVIIGKKYTVDGEVFVCKREDVPFELPLEIEDLVEDGLELKQQHLFAIGQLLLLMESVRAKELRKVPVTRDELSEAGVSKKVIQQLDDMGLVSERLIGLMRRTSLVDKDGNPIMQPAHSKPVVMFTNQGRAYVRKHINAEYGLAGKGHWDGVKDAADAIRAKGEHGADEPKGDHVATVDSSPVQPVTEVLVPGDRLQS